MKNFKTYNKMRCMISSFGIERNLTTCYKLYYVKGYYQFTLRSQILNLLLNFE